MTSRETSQLEEALLKHIEAAELKDTELAKSSLVPQPTISNFRNGKRGLSPASVEKIARALGYEVRLVKLRKRTTT